MSEEAKVTSIKIFDRPEGCCPDRFDKVEVKVGYGSGFNDPSSISCGVQSYKDSITYTYNCPANTRGNYISVKKLSTKGWFLHINYVEVLIC